MTRKAESVQWAWDLFRRIPYPGNPRAGVSQDWGARLLTLDAAIAGYASQVSNGTMVAAQVPNLARLIGEVEDLQRELGGITVADDEDDELFLRQCRSYVEALYHLIVELGELAKSELD